MQHAVWLTPTAHKPQLSYTKNTRGGFTATLSKTQSRFTRMILHSAHTQRQKYVMNERQAHSENKPKSHDQMKWIIIGHILSIQIMSDSAVM